MNHDHKFHNELTNTTKINITLKNNLIEEASLYFQFAYAFINELKAAPSLTLNEHKIIINDEILLQTERTNNSDLYSILNSIMQVFQERIARKYNRFFHENNGIDANFLRNFNHYHSLLQQINARRCSNWSSHHGIYRKSVELELNFIKLSKFIRKNQMIWDSQKKILHYLTQSTYLKILKIHFHKLKKIPSMSCDLPDVKVSETSQIIEKLTNNKKNFVNLYWSFKQWKNKFLIKSKKQIDNIGNLELQIKYLQLHIASLTQEPLTSLSKHFFYLQYFYKSIAPFKMNAIENRLSAKIKAVEFSHIEIRKELATKLAYSYDSQLIILWKKTNSVLIKIKYMEGTLCESKKHQNEFQAKALQVYSAAKSFLSFYRNCKLSNNNIAAGLTQLSH